MATLPRPDANQRLTIVLDEPGGGVGLIPIVDSTGRIITVIGAGDSVVGRVKITDGTDVADVLDLASANPLAVAILDGSGDQITSFGGGTQYTEDAAAAANPIGTVNILVRDDTPGTLVSDDGDNVAQRGTNYGAAFVQVVDSSGNFIDTFGGAGGTSAADDADFTATTTLGTPAMGVYESSPTSVTDNDMGIVGITQTRALKVSDASAQALLTTIDTDTSGIITAVQLIDDTVYVDDADWTDNTSKHLLVGGLYQATPQTVTDGDVAPFNITTNGALHVAVQNTVTVGSHAVTNAGTFVVQENGAALTALQLIDDVVYVDDTATHSTGSSKGVGIMAAATPTDSAISANDIGMVAMTTDRKLHVSVQDTIANVTTVATVSALGTGTTGPMKAEDVAHATGDMGIPAWGVRQDSPNATAAASNDYHYLATDMVGGLRTALYETDFAVLGTKHVKKYYTNAGAVTDGIVWSPAAGARWYVTDIYIQISAAATITLEDDLAGGDSAVWKGEFAANSGWSHSFATPLFSGEDAADLIITTTAGNVYVTVTGYEI